MQIKNINDVDEINIKEIVKDFIYSPGVFILYGKPKFGKSHFALQLGVEVSNHLGNLFKKEYIADKRKVLYISTELKSGHLKSRLKKYYNTTDFIKNFLILDEISENIIADIEEYIKENELGFIIIDMFIDTLKINIDKASEVNHTIELYQDMAYKYNCCFLLVMHSNENNNNQLSHSQAFRRKTDGYMYFEGITEHNFTIDCSMRSIKSCKYTFNRNSNLLYSIKDELLTNIPVELNEIIKFVSSQKDQEFKGSNQEIINKCNIRNINSIQLGMLIKNNINTLNTLGLNIIINGNNKSRKIWKYEDPEEKEYREKMKDKDGFSSLPVEHNPFL